MRPADLICAPDGRLSESKLYSVLVKAAMLAGLLRYFWVADPAAWQEWVIAALTLPLLGHDYAKKRLHMTGNGKETP
jgi:hypothetical protein